MAIYRLSTDAAGNAFTQTIFSGSDFNSNACRLAIYKGAMPTKTDLDSNHPDSLRSVDRLLYFAFPSSSWTTTPTTDNLATLNQTVLETATASGTAAWFLLHIRSQTKPMIAGSVSAPAGGGDLVIGSTTITSGLIYSLGSLIYSCPRVFT